MANIELKIVVGFPTFQNFKNQKIHKKCQSRIPRKIFWPKRVEICG
jgi:hypothetical protein